jgi:hypothetical protein
MSSSGSAETHFRLDQQLSRLRDIVLLSLSTWFLLFFQCKLAIADKTGKTVTSLREIVSWEKTLSYFWKENLFCFSLFVILKEEWNYWKSFLPKLLICWDFHFIGLFMINCAIVGYRLGRNLTHVRNNLNWIELWLALMIIKPYEKW